MADIIPNDVLPQLSTYELALLLLSAYLHDIGMTPEQRRVQTLYTFLLTNDPQEVPERERKEFVRWLDENRPGMTPPISNDPGNPDTYRVANEVITYYCRGRHVEWGEEWIRKHLSGLSLGTYGGWLDDLVSICRSHHEGYNDLRKDRFNPRYAGSPPVVVHLRYLAVVLRVADVLEFDPERTPDVILRHRDISKSSLVYWWKDPEMSMKRDGGRIVVWARPRSARIHKAVETTIQDVDAELSLSRRLAEETRFQTCPGMTTDLPHRWDLSPAVHADIRPRDDSYEYIDGSFRPDTQKLLQLLSGVELYGNELVAVRELLQNAFDAVRERIAYERLALLNPTDPSIEVRLGELNRVDMCLEVSAGGAWLVCVDTGVGMTKTIIQDHLLVSGVASRHDVLELERRCRHAGFTLGRTGQFGIGVLSYFMLADRVTIRTKRSQDPGDADAEGWNFETEGVGSFGELRRDATIARGTEVRLHLRQEILGGSLADWYAKLRRFVQFELSRIPCSFSLKSTTPDCEPLDLKAGFAYSQEQLAESITDQLKPASWLDSDTPVEVLPLKKKKEIEAEQRHRLDAEKELRQCLRWDIREGELPNKLGNYRIHLPYFDLPGGLALAFLRPRQKEGHLHLEKIGKGYCHIPSGQDISSWKGMRLARRYRDGVERYTHALPSGLQGTWITEVDWTSAEAGRIGVNPHQIDLSERALGTLVWLNQQGVDLCRTFLTRTRDSVYVSLNCRVMGTEIPESVKASWLAVREKAKIADATWEHLKTPLISVLSLMYEIRPETNAKWDSKSVSIVYCLGQKDDDDPYDGLAWHARNFPPDRICLRGTVPYFYGLTPLWTDEPTKKRPTHFAGLICPFPPLWRHLCGAQFQNYARRDQGVAIWNPENAIVQAVTAESWAWCTENFGKSLDPLSLKGSLLMEKARAASWVLMCLQAEQSDLWDGLSERDPSFLPTLWNTVFGGDIESRHWPLQGVFEWVEASANSRLRVLTPTGWGVYRTYEHFSKIKEYLPDPGTEWTVVLDDERSRQMAAGIRPGKHRIRR
jgi:hypothetical protein